MKTIKVHLSNESGRPEMHLVVAHITGIKRDMIGNLERATITTTSAGQLIRTTETYKEVLAKMEIHENP